MKKNIIIAKLLIIVWVIMFIYFARSCYNQSVKRRENYEKVVWDIKTNNARSFSSNYFPVIATPNPMIAHYDSKTRVAEILEAATNTEWRSTLVPVSTPCKGGWITRFVKVKEKTVKKSISQIRAEEWEEMERAEVEESKK